MGALSSVVRSLFREGDPAEGERSVVGGNGSYFEVQELARDFAPVNMT